MSLPRVFAVGDLAAPQTSFYLDQHDSAHLVKVLRLKSGDEFELVDGEGNLLLAIVRTADSQALRGEVLALLETQAEPGLKVVLVQGLPKGDKMELVVQKATELGVAEVVPLACEHSVVQYARDKAVKKVERWQKIAQEAAAQADRLIVPRIWPIQNLVDLGQRSDFWQGLHLLAWEKSKLSLKQILRHTAPPNRVVIYIGPEGSFSDSERDLLLEREVTPISLGPRILRTETAGLALLSMIMYEFDQIIP